MGDWESAVANTAIAVMLMAAFTPVALLSWWCRRLIAGRRSHWSWCVSAVVFCIGVFAALLYLVFATGDVWTTLPGNRPGTTTYTSPYAWLLNLWTPQIAVLLAAVILGLLDRGRIKRTSSNTTVPS